MVLLLIFRNRVEPHYEVHLDHFIDMLKTDSNSLCYQYSKNIEFIHLYGEFFISFLKLKGGINDLHLKQFFPIID